MNPGSNKNKTPHWHQRLYWRIWLTVAALVVVAAVAVAGLWRLDIDNDRAQRVGRELVVRGVDGAVVGEARILKGSQRQALQQNWRGHADHPDDAHERGRDADRSVADDAGHMGKSPAGPMFELALDGGPTVIVELPRPRRMGSEGVIDARWLAFVLTQPAGWAALAGALVALVALVAYPVVRRLTRRLERLQDGVQRFGAGDFSTRVEASGQDEVAFLARQFNDTAERVQALLNAHKSLLANASHELRSPLARIRMSMALMPEFSESHAQAGEGSAAADSAMAREEIERSIAELDALIGEILLASRLDHGGAANAPQTAVDLAALLSQECERMGIAADVMQHVRAPQVWTVNGHAHLLRRMLRNLLENAQRHGRAASHVGLSCAHVKARLWLDEAQRIRLSVSDDGPGVPPALRERIFEPFFRLPGASEREGGVGLGLALVRAIAREHGAQVHCVQVSEGGGHPDDLSGAVFVVAWP
jgi:two-component system, OmpR family, sensor kinase